MNSLTEKSNGLMDKLAEFSDELFRADEFRQYIRIAAKKACELVDATFASVMIFDLKENKIILQELSGLALNEDVMPQINIKSSDEITYLDEGEILCIDLKNKPQFLILNDPQQKSGIEHEIRIPFVISERLLFVLSLGQKTSGIDYSKAEIDALRVFTNILTMDCKNIKDVPDFLAKSLVKTTGSPSTQIVYKRSMPQDGLLGESSAIQEISNMIDRVAREDVSILITGESGTGKELVARAIHARSKRKETPLVAMNCAAMPDTLVESELFGYEKGAFTGAAALHKGKFEFANGSSLFLDEIGDMSLTTQARLLRVLQDGTFQRVGGNTTLRSDVRLITATNKDLRNSIRQGSFREDLFYRINVVQIQIPPLRERKADIPVLVQHYFQYFSRIYNKNIKEISQQSMDWLLSYDYPGNVRELRNIIERAVIMEQLDHRLTGYKPLTPPNFPQPSPEMPEMTLEELEKKHILKIFEKVNGNKSAAARILGIARKTLREKMIKYHIDPGE